MDKLVIDGEEMDWLELGFAAYQNMLGSERDFFMEVLQDECVPRLHKILGIDID